MRANPVLHVSVAILLLAGLSLGSPVQGGETFFLKAPDVEGAPGQQVSVSITLENTQGVHGFSFGLAHDGAPTSITAHLVFRDALLIQVEPRGVIGRVGRCHTSSKDASALPNGIAEEQGDGDEHHAWVDELSRRLRRDPGHGC